MLVASSPVSDLVLELIPGGCLYDRLKSHHLHLKEASRIWAAAQVADQVAKIHAKQWTHNDVAARNVMIRPDFEMVLGDFGMAKRAETADDYTKDYDMMAALLEEELFLNDGIKNAKLVGFEFPVPDYVQKVVDGLKARTIAMSDVSRRLIEGLEATWHACMCGCEKRFHYIWDMVAHRIIQTDYELHKDTALPTHRHSHDPLLPLHCTNCDSHYEHVKDLTRHMKDKHPNSSV